MSEGDSPPTVAPRFRLLLAGVLGYAFWTMACNVTWLSTSVAPLRVPCCLPSPLPWSPRSCDRCLMSRLLPLLQVSLAHNP